MSYSKTTWKTGDTITAQLLNHAGLLLCGRFIGQVNFILNNVVHETHHARHHALHKVVELYCLRGWIRNKLHIQRSKTAH